MHVIEFSPAGVATAMHNDELSLGVLGDQKITRATEIKFDTQTQRWGIWMPNLYGAEHGDFYPASHTAAHSFATYEAARKIEVQWLNQCRLDGFEPTSGDGYALLAGIRQNADNP